MDFLLRFPYYSKYKLRIQCQKNCLRFKIKWCLKFHEMNCYPKVASSWIQERKNIGLPKISKKDQEKYADFLDEKSRILAMLNQCKTPEELTIISEKIEFSRISPKKSKSADDSSQ